jgi:S1-C subfamily serine protease
MPEEPADRQDLELDSVQLGDWFNGAPFGLNDCDGWHRSATGDIAQQFQRFIQTDAAINPGIPAW